MAFCFAALARTPPALPVRIKMLSPLALIEATVLLCSLSAGFADCNCFRSHGAGDAMKAFFDTP